MPRPVGPVFGTRRRGFRQPVKGRLVVTRYPAFRTPGDYLSGVRADQGPSRRPEGSDPVTNSRALTGWQERHPAALIASLSDGRLVIEKEGKIAKFVPKVDQVSFSGLRARAQGQDITYVTERCVIRLAEDGLLITEVAAGLDIKRDILDQAATQLRVAPQVKVMDAALFQPGLMGLAL